jgi:hypothetical protein
MMAAVGEFLDIVQDRRQQFAVGHQGAGAGLDEQRAQQAQHLVQRPVFGLQYRDRDVPRHHDGLRLDLPGRAPRRFSSVATARRAHVRTCAVSLPPGAAAIGARRSALSALSPGISEPGGHSRGGPDAPAWLALLIEVNDSKIVRRRLQRGIRCLVLPHHTTGAPHEYSRRLKPALSKPDLVSGGQPARTGRQ